MRKQATNGDFFTEQEIQQEMVDAMVESMQEAMVEAMVEAMQESTEFSKREKGFDISTKEGLEAAKLYLLTEDPYISGFGSDPIDYFEGVDPEDTEAMEEAAAADELDRMMGELRVAMMLTCLERMGA